MDSPTKGTTARKPVAGVDGAEIADLLIAIDLPNEMEGQEVPALQSSLVILAAEIREDSIPAATGMSGQKTITGQTAAD